MNIKHLKSIDDLFHESNKWPDAIFPLIYHQQDFLSFLTTAVDGDFHSLVILQDDVICGFLPWMEFYNPSYGRVINSLPWFGNQGACYMFKNSNKTDVLSLLYSFKEYVFSLKDLFSATLNISPFDPYAVVYDEALSDTIITKKNAQALILPDILDDDNSNLMSLFDSKTRNLVRKSFKQGFILADGDNDNGWDFLFKIHTENMNAVGGKSKTKRHLDAMRQKTIKERREIMIAMLNNEPVAALLCLYQKPCVEYFVPAIKQEYRSLQPLSFLIMNNMINAVKNNYKYWNFGGTWESQKSLYHFKAGWGAIDFPYHYYTIINKKNENVNRININDSEKLLDAFPFYFSYPFHIFEIK